MPELNPAAALNEWYDQRRKWTADELRSMSAALAAPTVDAALDAWFGLDVLDGLIDEDAPREEWTEQNRTAMRQARAAGGVPPAAVEAPYSCSQEPHPGVEFYGEGGCAECGYRPAAGTSSAGAR